MAQSPINRNTVLNWDDVRAFITDSSQETSILIGVDSKRFLKPISREARVLAKTTKVKSKKVYVASYAKVVVVHIDSKHGCKLFGEVVTLPEYEQDSKKGMRMRLMQEVYMAGEMAVQIQDVVGSRRVEIHLDINKDPEHRSNSVMKEACGYIRGLTGIEAKVKPESLAAMTCADYITRKF